MTDYLKELKEAPMSLCGPRSATFRRLKRARSTHEGWERGLTCLAGERPRPPGGGWAQADRSSSLPPPLHGGSRTGAAAGARDCWGGRGGGALPAAPSSSRVQAALLVERRADAGEPCHRHPPFPCSAGTRGATQRTYVTSVPAELRKEDSPIAHAQKRLSQEPWDSEPWDSDSLSEPWDAHPLLGGWETLSAPREGPPGPGSPMSSGGESLRTG